MNRQGGPDPVELRLYDLQGNELMRLHEFIDLRWQEELVGGPAMLEATIGQDFYDELPASGFATARLYVRSATTDAWECWWGGVIEEMNPESPDRSTCKLIGQGWRRVLSFLRDYGIDFQPDLMPGYDVLSSTAYPHPSNAEGSAASLLLIAQQSVDYAPAGVFLTTQAGYYAGVVSATDGDVSPVGAATNAPDRALNGHLEYCADDLIAAAGEQSTPLLWWFAPEGQMHMGALPAVTAAHLVTDTHLLEIDARRDTSQVVNSVQAIFGDYGYPDVLPAVLIAPGPCPNYAPNADMADWQDVGANAHAVCPDTGANFFADRAWRCKGWQVGINYGSQEFAWYEVSQGHRMPTDGAGALAPPRGYGLTSLRAAVRRKPAATLPIIFQVETAYIDRLGVALNAWQREETVETLHWRVKHLAGRNALLGRETTPVDVSLPPRGSERVTADGRINLVAAGISGATMSHVQMYMHGYALPLGVTVDTRWTLLTYPSGTTTPQGSTSAGWVPLPSGELSATQTYDGVNLDAAGLLAGGARHLQLRWECRFPASVTSAEVQVCGVKVEHRAAAAPTPGDFQPDTAIQVWRNVGDADTGVTGDAAASITDYGLRHAAVRLPLPSEVTSVTALLDSVGGYLRSHAVPAWEIKGWSPERRRYRPQDGYVRLIGPEDYAGGAAYTLTRTEYRLDGGSIIPTLHLGTSMRYRRPSEPVDAGAAYIPPTNLTGTFRVPRYGR